MYLVRKALLHKGFLMPRTFRSGEKNIWLRTLAKKTDIFWLKYLMMLYLHSFN